MQPTIHVILVVIMLICFFCAAINRPNPSPLSIGWLGLFFFALDLLVGAGLR